MGVVKSALWFHVKRRICLQVSVLSEFLMLMTKTNCRTKRQCAYTCHKLCYKELFHLLLILFFILMRSSTMSQNRKVIHEHHVYV